MHYYRPRSRRPYVRSSVPRLVSAWWTRATDLTHDQSADSRAPGGNPGPDLAHACGCNRQKDRATLLAAWKTTTRSVRRAASTSTGAAVHGRHGGRRIGAECRACVPCLRPVHCCLSVPTVASIKPQTRGQSIRVNATSVANASNSSTSGPARCRCSVTSLRNGADTTCARLIHTVWLTSRPARNATTIGLSRMPIRPVAVNN